MTTGNAAEWDDLFSNQLISAVLSLVLDAWQRMKKPLPDELEPTTSLRLYGAILKSRDRQRHPFLPRYEDIEVKIEDDLEPTQVVGRKDLVFFPSLDPDIYFCLEAKRLNARVDGVMKSLASDYVRDGMLRFIKGQYSRHVRYGGMLGYVLDGDIDRAMKNVSNNIRSNRDELGCLPDVGWRPSAIRPSDSCARDTEHTRPHDQEVFRIHHLFVS